MGGHRFIGGRPNANFFPWTDALVAEAFRRREGGARASEIREWLAQQAGGQMVTPGQLEGKLARYRKDLEKNPAGRKAAAGESLTTGVQETG